MKHLILILILLFTACTYAQKKHHDAEKTKFIQLPEGDYDDNEFSKARIKLSQHSCGENDLIIMSDPINAIYQEWSDWNNTCTKHIEYGQIVNGKYKIITKKAYEDLTKGKIKRLIIERNYPAKEHRKKIKEKDTYGWWNKFTATFPENTKYTFKSSEICISGHHIKVASTEPSCPSHTSK